MGVIRLKPIQYPKSLQSELEYEILKTVASQIYARVLALLNMKPSRMENALSPGFSKVEKALESGTLTYIDGIFSGALDAGLTRSLRDVGAKWDSHAGVFRLSIEKLDPDLKHVIRVTQVRYRERMREVDKYLHSVDPAHIAGMVSVDKLYGSAIAATERSFVRNVKSLTVTPELTDRQRGDVVAYWRGKTHEVIKGLIADQVSRLRAQVAASMEVGTRYESLVRSIQNEYGISKGRAKLIARQETKSLVNSYAESRYSDIGAHEYRWHNVVGTAIHPTRARHKALGDASKKGIVYRFDDPPVVTEPGEPERRANPGFDFNCRCWSEPIVRF